MRNLFFALLGLVFFASCATDKKVAESQQSEPQSEPQQATRVPPTKWMQDTYPAISTTDPVTFYNEYEINIEAKIPKKIVMFQDGVTYYIDSSTVVKLTIPKLTSGVLISVKNENNLPKIMGISFDKNNPDYNVSFYAMSDKSFAQDANCQITFEGKKYKATATVVIPRSNSSIVMNHLLSNFESLDKTNKVENSAGGRNAIGTKIINQK